MKITILGSGSSGGVPLIGNYWGECDPNNPKNLRTRVSVLVTLDNKRNILNINNIYLLPLIILLMQYGIIKKCNK